MQRSNITTEFILLQQIAGWTTRHNAAPNPNAAVYTFAGADSFPGAKQGPHASYPLYGPGTGYNNGFVAPPGGGNFLASDGELAYQGSINQTISGLTPGVRYELSFVWGGNEFLDSTITPTRQLSPLSPAPWLHLPPP
jgi:hypothetical protein